MVKLVVEVELLVVGWVVVSGEIERRKMVVVGDRLHVLHIYCHITMFII